MTAKPTAIGRAGHAGNSITGSLADLFFRVSSMRSYGDEIDVGQYNRFGSRLVGVVFYTGFPGCPARYYATWIGSAMNATFQTIENATGVDAGAELRNYDRPYGPLLENGRLYSNR